MVHNRRASSAWMSDGSGSRVWVFGPLTASNCCHRGERRGPRSGMFRFFFHQQVVCCCDLQGRNINFTNSKTLVGGCRDRPSRSKRLLAFIFNFSSFFFFANTKKKNETIKQSNNQRRKKRPPRGITPRRLKKCFF